MVNDFFCDLLGYTRAELLSLDLYSVIDPEDVAAARLRYQRALPAGAPIFNTAKRYRHRDGRTIWADVISVAERDEDGQVRHFMSIVNDTTARHLAEKRQLQLSAQLQQAQKMEAVGRLTGGMAHDFNNLFIARGRPPPTAGAKNDQSVRRPNGGRAIVSADSRRGYHFEYPAR
jgi:PAS domain S-box-containing protein